MARTLPTLGLGLGLGLGCMGYSKVIPIHEPTTDIQPILGIRNTIHRRLPVILSTSFAGLCSDIATETRGSEINLFLDHLFKDGG